MAASNFSSLISQEEMNALMYVEEPYRDMKKSTHNRVRRQKLTSVIDDQDSIEQLDSLLTSIQLEISQGHSYLLLDLVLSAKNVINHLRMVL